MTVVTLRPTTSTDTITEDFWSPKTGAGTRAAILADSSDATYVDQLGLYANRLIVGFTPPSLPAGSVVQAAVLRARYKATTGSTASMGVLVQLGVLLAGGVYQSAALTIGATTTSATVVTVYGTSSAELQAEVWRIGGGSGSRVYELWLDLYYVAKPVVTVTEPTGTITTSNQVSVGWNVALDTASPAPYPWEVKIFTSAVYGGGGFSPDTSTPFTSIVGSDAGLTTKERKLVPTPLPAGTYRAYVRMGCQLGGTFWSSWAYSGFVMNPTLPSAPTVALTDQPASGRVRLIVTPSNSPVATNGITVQRKVGGVWVDMRNGESAGGAAVTFYDYEVQPGVLAEYQVRAWNGATLRNYGAAVAVSATPTGILWWIKHLTDSSLNMQLTLRSNPFVSNQVRQGIFQPMGRADAVVVSDTRGPDSGEITTLVTGLAGQDAIDALLDTASVLYLSGPASHVWRDRYVAFGDASSNRVIDNAGFDGMDVTLPWTEVGRPPAT